VLRTLAFLLLATTASSALAGDAPAAPAAPATDVPAVTDAAAAGDADADGDADSAPSPDAPSIAAPPAKAPPPPVDDELMKPMGTGEMLTSFAKTMLMLGVVLALAWLTLAKGMGKLVEKAQAGKRVKVIERIALDARRSLFLVEVDGKQFVVGGGDLVRLHDVGPETRPFTAVLTTASSQPAQTTPAAKPSSIVEPT
jgi:flagellar protein FliO/FliZ